MADDLTLKLRVTGNVAEAERLLGKLGSGIKGLTGGGGIGVFNIMGRGVSLFTAPLRLATGAALGLSAAFIGVSAAAAKAAAGDQLLESRLTALYGSAEKARNVFAGIEAMSLKLPFSPDDLTEAHFILQQIGLGGAKALESVGKAAAVSNEDVRAMAQGFAALSSRTFKKFGIDLKGDESGGGYEIAFRDRMGRIKKIAAKDADEARRSLLGIFGSKFGGGVGGLQVQFKLLGNMMSQGLGQFGKGLLPAIEKITGMMGDGATDLLQSGKLEELGKLVGEKLMQAAEKLREIIDRIPVIWDQLKTIFDTAPEKFMEVVKTGLLEGGKIIGTLFIEALGASLDIWATIGKVIGQAAMNHMSKNSLLGNLMFGNPKAVEVPWGKLADDFKTSFGDRVGRIGSQLSSSSGAMAAAMGMSGSTQYERGLYREGERTLGLIDYTAHRRVKTGRKLMRVDPKTGISNPHDVYEEERDEYRRTQGYPGQYETGTKGGWTIYIGNLDVRADRASQMHQSITTAAGQFAPSPAST